jgi:hypothetical protein
MKFDRKSFVAFWRDPRKGLPALIVCVVAITSVAAELFRRNHAAVEVPMRPVEISGEGYVQSVNCRSCHPGEYNSWFQSYHRTMTRRATPEYVKGEFGGVLLELDGNRYTLYREGDEYWIEMEVVGVGGPGRVVKSRHRVELITGSHHMQVYWYSTRELREVARLPFSYIIGEGWVPYRTTFIQPPEELPEVRSLHLGKGRWNDTCINCHTTHGRPRIGDNRSFLTEVAELGIACEACHGPAEEHIKANMSPLRRYGEYFKEETDTTITQPVVLSKEPASEVCAHCHGFFQFRDGEAEDLWKKSGFAYRPGGTHTETQFLFQASAKESEPQMDRIMRNNPHLVAGNFWSDGMARTSSREYNDMVETGCYKNGDMTCMSCHQMHKDEDDLRSLRTWADDQLGQHMGSDQACLQCHTSYAGNLTAHTHHTASSEGSRCYNCHMPYTDYGLLKSIRSHHIDSPDVADSVNTGRPGACNLCHLDQTLAWSADYLNEWFGIEKPALSEDETLVSASVLWALRGDPGVRALVASGMNWKPARQVSKDDWMVPFLGILADDPYDAVRYIAARTLRAFDGFEAFEFDPIPRPLKRDPMAPRIFWEHREKSDLPGVGSVGLLTPQGELTEEEINRLIGERDSRPFTLYE